MFSGIVEQLGVVTACEPCEFGRTLFVDPAGWTHRPAAGDSISVNGCCLTATDPGDRVGELRFDVIQQTLRMTTLGELKEGSRVNLEPAVTPTTMLSGHIVQGHVDGVGTVRAVTDLPSERRLRIEPPPPLMEFMIPKGSVAADGVSMTLAETGDSWFELALIPTTIERTTLGIVGAGDRVNLEADCVVKAVVTWLKNFHAK
jgi:riboflavin synthase alpha subunit